jgi:hypothetical protein
MEYYETLYKIKKVYTIDGKQVGYLVWLIKDMEIEEKKVGKAELVRSKVKFTNATVSASGVVRVDNKVPREELKDQTKPQTRKPVKQPVKQVKQTKQPVKQPVKQVKQAKLERFDNEFARSTFDQNNGVLTIEDYNIPLIMTSLKHDKDKFREGDYPWREIYGSVQVLRFKPGLRYIGPSSFTYFPRLKAVEFVDSIEIIESGAFYGCHLGGNLELPKSLQYIGRHAFGCNDFKNVSLPRKLRVMYKDAFEIIDDKTQKPNLIGLDGLKTSEYYKDIWERRTAINSGFKN